MGFPDIETLLLRIPPILLALTVHECAHAWSAMKLGDNTAYMLGRVTLNPIKHLDPIGTFMLFLSGLFGWAKPVPVNPRNFRDPSKGMMLTAFAGPLSNVALAILSALVYKGFAAFGSNLFFTAPNVYGPLMHMVLMSVFINIALAIFNMIPLPPLDGSRVLQHYLPSGMAESFGRLENYGFIILVVLVVSGVPDMVLRPALNFTAQYLLGGV